MRKGMMVLAVVLFTINENDATPFTGVTVTVDPPFSVEPLGLVPKAMVTGVL